jgi:hypothetical protein
MMRRRTILTAFLLLTTTVSFAQKNLKTIEEIMVDALRQWKAGTIVNAKAVQTFGGEGKCFVAEPIPDNV